MGCAINEPLTTAERHKNGGTKNSAIHRPLDNHQRLIYGGDDRSVTDPALFDSLFGGANLILGVDVHGLVGAGLAGG